jgi:glutamate formiminotransferase
MSVRLMEAVPNFSEGRDAVLVQDIVAAMRATGAGVLDWSSDPDHHRSVVTVVGPPDEVEEAALAGARVAVERIDLRRHQGAHPRIGALDVLPFVPLIGLSLAEARTSAHRVGTRIASDLGVPVFFYSEASDPPGRTLAELRQGGYEAMVARWPEGRQPDRTPPDWSHPGAHPTAGATCVGAREVLLAWNVMVAGLTLEQAAGVAAAIRESGGGLPGVRALALGLPSRRAIQISMNLERAGRRDPMPVFRRLEQLVGQAGGAIVETEVVGLVPDALVLSAAEERLKLASGTTGRLLSGRLLEHLAGQPPGPVQTAPPASLEE